MLNTPQFTFATRAVAVALVMCTIVGAHHVCAQTTYEPAPENLQARREFQDM